MVVYIPQGVDVYNTHLLNLIKEYEAQGVVVILGYDIFVYSNIIPDIIHFHMPNALFDYIKNDNSLFFERLHYFKSQGAKIYYTGHNLVPHFKLDGVDYVDFYQHFISFVDVFVHHGESSIPLLQKTYKLPEYSSHIVCPHGDYLDDMKDFKETKFEARKILHLKENKKVILVFGNIQYKNISFVNLISRRLKENSYNTYFLIAGVKPLTGVGKIDKYYYKINNEFINLFRFNRTVIHKRLSQHEMYLIFKASDIVFLPHSEGLTSGIIPMAATLQRPIVFPDIGCFKDQAKHTLSMAYLPLDVQGALEAFQYIFDRDTLEYSNKKWLEANSWYKHVERIVNSWYKHVERIGNF